METRGYVHLPDPNPTPRSGYKQLAETPPQTPCPLNPPPLPVHNAAFVQVCECRHNLCCVQPRNILVKHTLDRGTQKQVEGKEEERG